MEPELTVALDLNSKELCLFIEISNLEKCLLTILWIELPQMLDVP